MIGRNVTWLLLSQVATWVITLVSMIAVPRLLGASGLGSLAFAMAYVGFLGLAVGLGTSQLVTREVARDHSLAPSYVFNGVILKLALTTVLGIAAVIGGVVFDFSSEVMALVVIGILGLYPAVVCEIYFGVLSGMQRMGKVSALSTGSLYVVNIVSILVLWLGGNVVAFYLIITLNAVITMVGMMLLLPHVTRGHRQVSWSVMRFLVRAGIPLMLLTVFNQIYTTIDIPILAALTDDTVVGWYVLAYRWAAIPIFIAAVASNSFYPEMSKHGPTGGPAFANLVNRALQLVLLVAVPAGIGLAVVAGDLLRFIYDDEFVNSVVPLQILALQLPITCVDTILGTAIVATGRVRKYLIVAGAMACVNPLLNVVAIRITDDRYGNGAIGAAIATAVTELLVMSCGLAMSARGVMNLATVSWTVRCVLAGASIVLVGAFAGSTPLLVQIALGVVLYLAASFALRSITPAMIRETVGQFTGTLRRGSVASEP